MKKMLKQNTTSLEKLYVKPKISKKFLVNFKITIRKGSSTQGRLTFSARCFRLTVLFIIHRYSSYTTTSQNNFIYICYNQSNRYKSTYFHNIHNFGGNVVHMNFLWRLSFQRDPSVSIQWAFPYSSFLTYTQFCFEAAFSRCDSVYHL